MLNIKITMGHDKLIFSVYCKLSHTNTSSLIAINLSSINWGWCTLSVINQRPLTHQNKLHMENFNIWRKYSAFQAASNEDGTEPGSLKTIPNPSFSRDPAVCVCTNIPYTNGFTEAVFWEIKVLVHARLCTTICSRLVAPKDKTD